MYATTFNSVSKLLSGATRPIITITLDNPQQTYTTFSPLAGTVTITAPTTSTFSTIDIEFEGTTSTFVEKMASAASNYRSTATHKFLKLNMPIPRSSYPSKKTFIAGVSYTFPFNFAVPNQLLLQCCTHPTASKHIHFAHLALPPSMGNANPNQKTDQSPEMAKITYAIRVNVSKYIEPGRLQKLCEASLTVKILPAIPEAPPMNIELGDKDYKLLKSKVLKKGMFKGKGKLGRITLSAEQPRDFMLPAPQMSSCSQPLISSSNSTSSASSSANFSPFSSSDSDNTLQPPQTTSTALTHLKLHLSFIPDSSASAAKPPRLSSLTSKLRTTTFYAARPALTFPLRSQLTENYDPNSGFYEHTISLPSRNLESIAWLEDDSPIIKAPPPPTAPAPAAPPLYEATAPATRRERRGSDSGYSTLSDREHKVPRKEKETATGISYTADISLPLSLPSEKAITWLPSFHSCLVSRTYTLELSLSLASGTIVPSTTLSLKIPVQIGVLATGERRGSGTGPAVSLPVIVSSPLSGGQSQPGEEDLGRIRPPGYEVFVGSGSSMAQQRRGENTMPSIGGASANIHDVEGNGISLVTGGEWSGVPAGLSGHGR